MAKRDDRRRTLLELQEQDGEDLSFGGWRDWILVLVAIPVMVGGIYAGAMLAVGSRSGGVLLSPTGGLIVTAVAVVIGLLAGGSERLRRRASGE